MFFKYLNSSRNDATKPTIKVRSRGCFAVHLLFFSCARFGMADGRRDASE